MAPKNRVGRVDVGLNRVAGVDNPADLMTKSLTAARASKHLRCLGVHFEEVRSGAVDGAGWSVL